MKRFLWVFLFSLLMAQVMPNEHILWQNKRVTNTETQIEYSDAVDLTDDIDNTGLFHGLVQVELDVDNEAGAGDSVAFYPEYWKAGQWVTGGIMVWNVVPAIADENFSETRSYILPQSADSSAIFVWQTDPTNTANLQGFIFTRFRIKRVDNAGSSYVIRRLTVTQY
jgi:hypothetical protein